MPKNQSNRAGKLQEDNQVVQIVDSISIFDKLTYYEVAELIRIVYMNMFNFSLALSRLIDLHPVDQKMEAIKSLQKFINKGLFGCEVLTPRRHKQKQLEIDQQN